MAMSVLALVAAGVPFQLSNTLGSHAVLQPPVVIWGLGTPGASVTTTVSGSASPIPAATTTVGADGVWRQPLPSLVEQGLASVAIASSSEKATVTISDILVGKVFLCSGQSNVDLVTVDKAFNATEEMAAAVNFPNVRTAQATHTHAWSGPLVDAPLLSQNWSRPTPTNIATFSATCWFAARDLFNQLGGKTAVGVFQSSYGGTAVRNWVPTAALAACSQPWSGQQPYGYNPYTHSTLYNGMIGERAHSNLPQAHARCVARSRRARRHGAKRPLAHPTHAVAHMLPPPPLPPSLPRYRTNEVLHGGVGPSRK